MRETPSEPVAPRRTGSEGYLFYCQSAALKYPRPHIGIIQKLTAACLVLLTGAAVGLRAQPVDFILGADVSHLDRVEQSGGVFYDETGSAGDALGILRDHGFNWIRLRLWHTPSEGFNDLDRTLAIAGRIHSHGFRFLLDLHYSDTWADPGQQAKPTAWLGLGFDLLKDSVRTYTADVVRALRAQGTLPDVVQIGNEITAGLLWPDGRVGGSYDSPAQWRQLGELLQAAREGVREAAGDSVKVMIHIDRGGSTSVSRWFFDHLTDQDVAFDMIGLSFYPWWHGELSDLEANLTALANRYGKDVLIVETAYPWTLEWSDDQHNVVGLPDHEHPGYAATIEGQHAFISDLISTVRDTPRGRGVVYWEPAYISAPQFGSSWENLALFDFDGHVLSSANAFREAAAVHAERRPHPIPQSIAVYPNPARDSAAIRLELSQPASVVLEVFDNLGRLHRREEGFQPAGTVIHMVETATLIPGAYVYRIRLDGRMHTSGLLIIQ